MVNHLKSDFNICSKRKKEYFTNTFLKILNTNPIAQVFSKRKYFLVYFFQINTYYKEIIIYSPIQI